jgi:hypothetical protein
MWRSTSISICRLPAIRGRLVVAVKNVSADLNPFVDWYGGGLERQIERAFPPVPEFLPTGLGACPNIKIEHDGTVRVFG